MTSGIRVNSGGRVTSGTRAGFFRRFAALIYDGFLLVALLMIFTAVVLVFTPGHHAVLRESAGPWYFAYRAGEVCVIGAYYVLNWMRSGQTLGMRAWHLRTVDASGRLLRFRGALLRFVCGLVAWPPAALGVLWLYADREHLALHDRLSHSRVVRLTRA